MSSRRFWPLRGHEIRVLACAFLAALLAKGAAFSYAYSIDDYALYLHPVSSKQILSQGRFGQYVMAKFLYLIGPGPPHITIVAAFILLLAAALFGTLITRHWGISRQHSLAAIAACIITTHPYTTSIFAFRYNLSVTACAFALMTLVLLFERRSTVNFLLKISLFAAALSVYQVIFNYALMIVLIGCVISLTRYLVVSNRISPNRRARRLLSPSRFLRHRNSELLIVVVLGTLLYLILNKIILAASGIVESTRAKFVSFDDIDVRIGQLLKFLKADLVHSDTFTFIPIFTQRILWVLAALGLIGLLYHFFVARIRFKEIFGWHRVLSVAVLVLAAGAAVVWMVGVNVALEIWYAPPRVREHVGVLWAGALVLPYYCAGKHGRRLLLLVAAVAIASFISVSNGILSDQIRLNTRDRLFANRVLTRLEMLPDFPQVDFVAIANNSWPHGFEYEVDYQTMRYAGTFKPAFSVDWAKVNILKEMSGYDLKPAGASDMEIAKEYCKGVEIWPADSSIVIRDRVAIICVVSPK